LDKVRALQYLASAAAEKSFSGAARVLGVTVPAVARMIKALEDHLGLLLFERSPRGLTLTAGGSSYLEECMPLLADLAAADDHARASSVRLKGTLVVGCQEVIAKGCLTAALPTFHSRYPDIELDVRDFLSATEEQVSGVDVMLMVGWPKAPDLVCRRIGESRFRVLASPSYWTAHGKPQQPQDLERHVCFNLRGNYGRVMDVWNFMKGGEQQMVIARGWLTTSNAHRNLVQQLVLRGHGVARFLDWADFPEVAAGALVPALTDWEITDRPPVNVLYSAATRRNPRARVFIQFMTELFGDLDRARGLHASGTAPPPWMRRANGRASDYLEHRDRSRSVRFGGAKSS
jgi:DNA-binding transcriptional LysR family regulator